MAGINISIDSTTGLFTVELDQQEWLSLEVNGKNIPAINKNGYKFIYQQEQVGNLHFIAIADYCVCRVNPSKPMYLKGKENSTYACIVSYLETTSPRLFYLHGVIIKTNGSVIGAQEYPIMFSQEKLTGKFQKNNKEREV